MNLTEDARTLVTLARDHGLIAIVVWVNRDGSDPHLLATDSLLLPTLLKHAIEALAEREHKC